MVVCSGTSDKWSCMNEAVHAERRGLNILSSLCFCLINRLSVVYVYYSVPKGS